jgi:hypothetical protein
MVSKIGTPQAGSQAYKNPQHTGGSAPKAGQKPLGQKQPTPQPGPRPTPLAQKPKASAPKGVLPNRDIQTGRIEDYSYRQNGQNIRLSKIHKNKDNRYERTFKDETTGAWIRREANDPKDLMLSTKGVGFAKNGFQVNSYDRQTGGYQYGQRAEKNGRENIVKTDYNGKGPMSDGLDRTEVYQAMGQAPTQDYGEWNAHDFSDDAFSQKILTAWNQW